MKRRIPQFIFVVMASVALAGCAGTPEISRAKTSVQTPQVGALSALQRQFRSQARTVVYFDFDRDTLNAEARARLNEQAAWILKNKNIRFRVYGHTDKVGGNRYNYQLGLRRANRVVDYLVSKGISPDRLEAMVSFGENSPALNTEDRERLNRRVVTEVHGYIRSAPSVNSAGASRTSGLRGGGSTRATSTSIGDTGSSTTGGQTTTSNSGSKGSKGSGSNSNSGSKGNKGSGSNSNSGRGNGDEAGDPGNSGGRNNGGDEV